MAVSSPTQTRARTNPPCRSKKLRRLPEMAAFFVFGMLPYPGMPNIPFIYEYLTYQGVLMQRSYLVKSPVHFADFGFFVKVGDILVHDTANSNKLTVYRNGGVVKAVQQTTLGIAAMVK